jgi:hypothetical protein
MRGKSIKNIYIIILSQDESNSHSNLDLAPLARDFTRGKYGANRSIGSNSERREAFSLLRRVTKNSKAVEVCVYALLQFYRWKKRYAF